MSELELAIINKDNELVTKLLVHRLKGAQLDIPFNQASGDQPRDIIVSLYSIDSYKQIINNSVNEILITSALETAKEICNESDIDFQAYWLIQFLKLLLDIQFVDNNNTMTQLCQVIANLDHNVNVVQNLGAVSFSAYLKCVTESQSRAIQFFAPALTNNDVAQCYCLEAIKADPKIFLTDLAPYLITHFKRREFQINDLEYFSEALCNVFNLDNNQELNKIIEEFLKDSSQVATSIGGKIVRQIIVEALTRSSLPTLMLQKFEQQFWDTFPPSNILDTDDPKLIASKEELQKFIKRKCGDFETNPFHININSIPYAEDGLLRLHELLLEMVYRIPVKRFPDKYSEIRNLLKNETIQIAVHNPSITQKLPSEKDGSFSKLMLQSNFELVTYLGYEILVSQQRLLTIIFESGNVECSEIANDLLSGVSISDLINQYGSSKVLDLIKLGEITFLLGTDTELVAKSVFGEIPEEYVHDISPDDGLARLLDGEVLFYIGGALQANYAQVNCSSRVMNVGQKELQTELRFYVTKSVWNKQSELILQCALLWKGVIEIWKLLKKPQTAPQNLQPILYCLQQEILLNVNRDRATRNGFVTSFMDLQQLIEKYDTFSQSSFDAIDFVEVNPQESSIVISPEVKEKVEELQRNVSSTR